MAMVLAVFLARGTWAQLVAAGAFLALCAAFKHPGTRACRQALWRLRMLCLAVPVIHLLAHGQAGLHAALRDVAGLVLMVLTVVVLLNPQGNPRVLLGGLAWWLRPLERVGLPGKRFALCMGLTLQWVPWAQQALAQCTGRPAKRLVRLARTLAVARPPALSVQMPDVPGPPPWQWTVPLALLAWLWLANRLPVPGLTSP